MLDAIELQTGDHPKASVIVLHGLGADGHDFVPVCEAFDLDAVGDVRFVLPHAPHLPVTLNNGVPMPAWYDLYGTDLVRREDEVGVRRSQQAIDALIRRERERGVPASRIVLAGFSQGCAMTLFTGLRFPERLAGLAGLSGYLPLSATASNERHIATADMPVFLAHGRNDDIVAPARGAAARDTLVALGHPVEWHEYPMAHQVCVDEIADLNRWLVKVLGA